MLQAQGFDRGETFAETGFGKFDEAFIHEIGVVGERPAMLPFYLKAYRPEFVVCSTFCYQWPYYLREEGWQPIFYSPNSSVWAQPGTRPDLPRVSDGEIEAAFDRDIATNGQPVDTRLLGRNLIALNSLGLEDFAFAKLTGLPEEQHRLPWYWEAARFMCFAKPEFSAAHRQALMDEANRMPENGVTAEFRAYALAAAGDQDGARGRVGVCGRMRWHGRRGRDARAGAGGTRGQAGLVFRIRRHRATAGRRGFGTRLGSGEAGGWKIEDGALRSPSSILNLQSSF